MAIVHKITLCAIDSVHYAWFLTVRIVSLFGARKKAVDGLLWFVSYFDLLLFQNATYFLGNALYIRQHYKTIEVVFGGLFGKRSLAVSNKRPGIVVISQNGFDSLRFFSSSFIRWRNVVCSFQQSADLFCDFCRGFQVSGETGAKNFVKLTVLVDN